MSICEACGQEVWKESSWKNEFDTKYAKLMNSGDVEWIDKANEVLCKALDKISALVKKWEKVAGVPLKAHEVLIKLCGLERCAECKNSVSDDWEFKDFTSKTIVICPQCKTEYNVEQLQDRFHS